ncbi:hypothetical protein C2845_PM07G31770 [Panicum miliaceum]|uniref:Uncharacterized protein n=1 Tax=Panicum miliaceum TaxID=4540 RepID=A0A3L6SQU5_PANMI|nr:hypothetical protein C2845_PM07G31770 [Panicum miliaceum]
MSSEQMTPKLDLPCIAFLDYDHRSTTLISLSEHKRVAAGNTDEVLRNKIVTPTARGLLLVRDPDTMATFLYNPASSDKVHLPPLRGVDDAVLMDSHCLLSTSPPPPAASCCLSRAGTTPASGTATPEVINGTGTNTTLGHTSYPTRTGKKTRWRRTPSAPSQLSAASSTSTAARKRCA